MVIKGMDNLRIDMGDSIKKSLQQYEAVQSATIKREARYKQDILDVLQGIEKNTANLNEIVTLIYFGNEKQEEIFNLLVEMLEIAKSNNLAEAESKYRNVMKKAADFTGDVETIKKLVGFGNIIWEILKPFF